MMLKRIEGSNPTCPFYLLHRPSQRRLGLLTIDELIVAMEEAYAELAAGRGIYRVRTDMIAETDRPDDIFALKSMDGVIPKFGVGTIRVNSDTLRYPDRIAERRPGGESRYRLSNGKGAVLPAEDALRDVPYLAIALVNGNARDARIRIAAPISAATIEHLFENEIADHIGSQNCRKSFLDAFLSYDASRSRFIGWKSMRGHGASLSSLDVRVGAGPGLNG